MLFDFIIVLFLVIYILCVYIYRDNKELKKLKDNDIQSVYDKYIHKKVYFIETIRDVVWEPDEVGIVVNDVTKKVVNHGWVAGVRDSQRLYVELADRSVKIKFIPWLYNTEEEAMESIKVSQQ